MATVLLSPVGNGQQFFDNNGVPLAGGLIYTYIAGSSTLLATYTTNAGTIANSNPIVLDSAGRTPNEIWMDTGYSYKFILKTATFTTLQTLDNLYPILQTAVAPNTTIPAGLIAIWSGSTGSIPTGWVLCNGTNGTPDLRNNFVVGAGSTYAVGATGGSANAVVVSHTHVITDPGHLHNTASTGASSTLINAAAGNITSASTSTTSTATTGITNQSTGVSGTNANLPPYYALAYIMKT
jgi:microcystin-dependent protein